MINNCFDCIKFRTPSCEKEVSDPTSLTCDMYIQAPFKYNYPTTLDVQVAVFQKIKQEACSEGITYSTIYTIHEARIGEGNNPIFIVTSRRHQLQSGRCKLYIQPIKFVGCELEIIGNNLPVDKSEYRGIKKIAERLSIPLKVDDGDEKRTKTTKELFESIIQEHREKPVLFTKIHPIPLEELKKIDNTKLIECALDRGLKKDPALTYGFRGDIPVIDPNVIAPSEYMPYSPNKIYVTGTKPGKSTLAEAIGKRIERPTPAGLLGFSTADHSHKGVLHGSTLPVYVDEVMESDKKEKDEALSGIRSYMEIGTYNSPRALGIYCEGHSSITFMSNPRLLHQNSQLSKPELTDQFRDILKHLTDNPEVLASRIALLLYRERMQPVEGAGLNYETEQKLNAYITSIREIGKKEYSKLFKNPEVVKWLNKKLNGEYITALDKLLESETLPYDFQHYIRGAKSAHRHVKGFALAQAWVDYLDTYIKIGKVDVDEILGLANKHLDRIISENLISLQELTNEFTETVFIDYQGGVIEALFPEYAKLLVKTVLIYWSQGNKTTNLILLDSLRDAFLFVRRDDSRYDTFTKFSDAVIKSKSKLNVELIRFGFNVLEIGDNIFGVKIIDPKFIEKYTASQRWIAEMTDLTDKREKKTGKTGQTGQGGCVRL